MALGQLPVAYFGIFDTNICQVIFIFNEITEGQNIDWDPSGTNLEVVSTRHRAILSRTGDI